MELILFSDSSNNLQVCKGVDFGNSYEKVASIKYKSCTGQYAGQNFEVVDAMFISTHKIMTIVKISTYKGCSILEELSEAQGSPEPVKVSHEFQIWEINGKSVKKAIGMFIPSD